MLKNAPINPYIPVTDLQEARRFYEEKLGSNPEKEFAGGCHLRCGEGTTFIVYKSDGSGYFEGKLAFGTCRC